MPRPPPSLRWISTTPIKARVTNRWMIRRTAAKVRFRMRDSDAAATFYPRRPGLQSVLDDYDDGCSSTERPWALPATCTHRRGVGIARHDPTFVTRWPPFITEDAEGPEDAERLDPAVRTGE